MSAYRDTFEELFLVRSAISLVLVIIVSFEGNVIVSALSTILYLHYFLRKKKVRKLVVINRAS